MESDRLRVVIDPERGGRIRSFLSKRTGREYLYQDPRTEFSGDGYSDNDVSGYCECFPTVAPCLQPSGKYGGKAMGDHGYLWQGPWQTQIESDAIVLSRAIPEFDCHFQRTCHLQAGCRLDLDYSIRNDGDEPFHYVYSAHPLLSGGPHTRLEFPPEMSRAFVYVALNAPEFHNQSWIDWPQPDNATLNGPYSGDRESVVKLFSDKLSNGWVAVHHTDIGEALQIDFDTSALPYLGVLVSQGYYEPYDGLKGSVFLALEPTTGIGDDLPTCELTGTVSKLEAGQTCRFRISLTIHDEL